jgi:hypothetical protein
MYVEGSERRENDALGKGASRRARVGRVRGNVFNSFLFVVLVVCF